MMALLVLFVLLLIAFQLSISTGTDARVVRNEETIKAMDLSTESYLLQVYEDLRLDGEDAAAAGDAGNPLGGMGEAMAGLGGDTGGEGGEAEPPTDSRRDGWSRPVRTEELNEVRLRVIVQDEDSKFNILSLLTEDEDESGKAFERLVRILEFSRKGTDAEIDGSQARQMAQVILEYMNRREDQYLPRTELLSDDEDNEDWGLPLSLREFVAADSEVFTADHFRDYRDEQGMPVHSLGNFLTVWTSLTTAENAPNAGAGGGGVSGTGGSGTGGAGTTAGEGTDAGGRDSGTAGDSTTEVPGSTTTETGGSTGSTSSGSTSGVAVNLNTAPLAVLKGLLDDRDLPYNFWEDVLLYRNQPDEEEEQPEEEVLDEYGEPVDVIYQIFESVDELAEIDGWTEIEPIIQGELQNLLTVQSNVFSIYVTARKLTGEQETEYELGGSRLAIEEEEERGEGIVRTVRSVVWRRQGSDGSIEIVPLQRWEVVDYVPILMKDFPEDDERR